jgi:uncharacterized protein (TIGR02118 family)
VLSVAERGNWFSGEVAMSNIKLVVIYPGPTDVDAFEKTYINEHVPMAVEKMKGKTEIVATKAVASPRGVAPFYRIAEEETFDFSSAAPAR